jgi:hypothetical protein
LDIFPHFITWKKIKTSHQHTRAREEEKEIPKVIVLPFNVMEKEEERKSVFNIIMEAKRPRSITNSVIMSVKSLDFVNKTSI